MKVDEILDIAPFELSSKQKEKIFLEAMRESFNFHYNNSKEFQKICNLNWFNPEKYYSLNEAPYLPVSLFKKIILLSVSKEKIKKEIKSSATTNQTPSTILLDDITIHRQIKAIKNIFSDFLGKNRKNFIIVDSEKTIKSSQGQLSSRASAIRGILPFAKSINYILEDNLILSKEKLENALAKLGKDEEVCIFGFTWLIFKIISENDGLIGFFKDKLNSPWVLHIGGWKKLKDINISKNEFSKRISAFFNTSIEKVRDFYGMTEQLGTVYIDCEKGHKHVPLYSDILIRDVKDFSVKEVGDDGFIQLLSPLPNSYPGISLLTEDIGSIIGEDDCPCGRKGKYFLFKERAKEAEIKGCGDTLNI